MTVFVNAMTCRDVYIRLTVAYVAAFNDNLGQRNNRSIRGNGVR